MLPAVPEQIEIASRSMLEVKPDQRRAASHDSLRSHGGKYPQHAHLEG
jgi:hypothetical protein